MADSHSQNDHNFEIGFQGSEDKCIESPLLVALIDMGGLLHHNSEVWAAKFTSDGKYVISGSVDSTVKVTDVASRDVVHILVHPSGVPDVSISENDKYILIGSLMEK